MCNFYSGGFERRYMKKYVALLRGINIGGKNKIKMSELKSAFEMAGLTEVRTVLNSGNISFSSEADMNEEIIENIILEHFKMKNLQIVPIGDLIYYDNFKIDNFGTQIKI